MTVFELSGMKIRNYKQLQTRQSTQSESDFSVIASVTQESIQTLKQKHWIFTHIVNMEKFYLEVILKDEEAEMSRKTLR